MSSSIRTLKKGAVYFVTFQKTRDIYYGLFQPKVFVYFKRQNISPFFREIALEGSTILKNQFHMKLSNINMGPILKLHICLPTCLAFPKCSIKHFLCIRKQLTTTQNIGRKSEIFSSGTFVSRRY